jgi:TRAP-type mannitol/chloroaromatic compound transport system substrate-binding protein
MKKPKLLVLLALVTALALGAAGSNAAAAETIKWKAQAFWSAAEETYKTFADFCNKVKTLTDGRLEITPYPAGAIVPTFEALDALENNVIQAMHMAPVYWTGKNPAFAPIGELTAAWTHPWQMDAWMQYKGGLDMLNEIYAPFNAYTVGYLFWGVESFVSKVPIGKPEDFKGLKVRAPQGMTAQMLQKLGASVVVLPGGEVYSALDKGVIDASDWATISMNDRMGFYQVAKYSNFPGFHSMPLGDFTANIKEWRGLPPDVQQILTTAAREWCWDSVERVAIQDYAAIGKLKEQGVTLQAWSKADLDRVREMTRAIWDEWAKKNVMSAKVIESQKAWLKELGLIE